MVFRAGTRNTSLAERIAHVDLNDVSVAVRDKANELDLDLSGFRVAVETDLDLNGYSCKGAVIVTDETLVAVIPGINGMRGWTT